MRSSTSSSEEPRSAKANERGPFLDHAGYTVPFGSNAVRLGFRSWLVVAIVLAAVYIGLPRIWKRLEPLECGPDYRIPSALSEDYWLYSRYAEKSVANVHTVPIVGDSVMWGQYVTPDETLSYALNHEFGSNRFANLGVNGSHPVALAGLLKYYAGSIANRKVLLHFNPLWMSSERRDLTVTKPTAFNHQELVPQFLPVIPCYKATVAERLSIAVTREVPFLAWISHLDRVYFQNESVSSWTVGNPYTNPLHAITLELPQPENKAPSDPIPWTKKDAQPQSFSWVPTQSSLQWAFFKQSLATLRQRDDDVYVLVGPFNEHMLTPENRLVYASLRDEIVQWLEKNSVAYFAPLPLPSEMYADASHPLKDGYVVLAHQLLQQKSFVDFLGP